MTVEELCINKLKTLENILLEITEADYFIEHKKLNSGSLADTIDFTTSLYLCLIEGASAGTVCYEVKRKEESVSESKLKHAIYTLQKIQANIPRKIKNFALNVKRINSNTGETIAMVSTTYCRELLFCYESSFAECSKIESLIPELKNQIRNGNLAN
ncbi:MAG: hypothetical protein HYZ14_08765 [Bacteroidetes bacterium]|nr:hypothetical protein [Bacteroidota bacterium]